MSIKNLVLELELLFESYDDVKLGFGKYVFYIWPVINAATLFSFGSSLSFTIKLVELSCLQYDLKNKIPNFIKGSMISDPDLIYKVYTLHCGL